MKKYQLWRPDRRRPERGAAGDGPADPAPQHGGYEALFSSAGRAQAARATSQEVIPLACSAPSHGAALVSTLSAGDTVLVVSAGKSASVAGSVPRLRRWTSSR